MGDWLPRRREEVIATAEDWGTYITTERAAAWNVPAAALTELAALKTAAKSLLDIVDGPESTSVKVAECKTAFGSLEAKMRDLKRRYFLKPPLADADLVAMNLPIPDRTPSEIGVPTVHVGLAAKPVGNREVEVTRTVAETGAKATPYGMDGAVLYEKVGGAAPAGPEELTKSQILKRLRTTRVYGEEDRRKPVWYAARWQNEKGEEGPWGDIVESTIP
jgi:hypothetical protein